MEKDGAEHIIVMVLGKSKWVGGANETSGPPLGTPVLEHTANCRISSKKNTTFKSVSVP